MEVNRNKVFISSTLKDLRKYRSAVRDALEKLGLEVLDNEFLDASPDEPLVAMYKMIDQCDIFVGIYARYYGRIPQGENVSYIENEYNYAKSAGKPQFCFFLNDKYFPWPQEWEEEDPRLKSLLYRFQEKITKERIIDFYTTPEDLAERVFSAVQKYLVDIIISVQPQQPAQPIKTPKSQQGKQQKIKGKPRQPKPSSTSNTAPAEDLGFVEVNKTPKTDSDQPSGVDRLNYNKYANAFAQIILNTETSTPLTIGLYGQWGQGKSFLMRKIKEALYPQSAQKGMRRLLQMIKVIVEDWDDIRFYFRMRFFSTKEISWKYVQDRIKKRRAEPLVKFRIVEFNAWEYVGTEHLWAGLVTKLYKEAENYLGLQFHIKRLGRALRRSLPKSFFIFTFYALIGFLISLVLNYEGISTSLGQFGIAAKTLGVSVLGGAGLAGLPILWTTLKDFSDNLFLARSQSLQNLVAKPNFKAQIGIMGEIKEAVNDVCELLATRKNGQLTRFVLFVDDLDRCDHKKAVEVLQAIMLLLNFKDGAPFVTFLSLDARVLVRAIETTYGEVLVKAGINGYEYLDKIVQLPFVIPPASDEDIKNYVESMLWSSEEEKERVSKKFEEKQPLQPSSEMLQPSQEEVNKQQVKKAENILGQPLQEYLPFGGEALPGQPDQISTMFTKVERDALLGITGDKSKKINRDLNDNPRKIKRIINIYRFIRQLFPPDMDRKGAIHWVLMTEQWPFHVAWLLEEIENDEQTQRQELNGKNILDVYARVKKNILAKEMSGLLEVDADPEVFEQFIKKEPVFSVAEIKNFKHYTFNLNPAIKSEVSKQAIRLMVENVQPKKKTTSKKKILASTAKSA
jgi:Cdc6-like AAA superfamily ATPase